MDLERLIAMKLVGKVDDEPDALPKMPLKEAQRAELALVRRDIENNKTPRLFKMWDEVRPAYRTSSFRQDFLDSAVLVFWSYEPAERLIERIKIVGMNPQLYAPDCLIAWMSAENLRFEVADSSMLVLVNPDAAA